MPTVMAEQQQRSTRSQSQLYVKSFEEALQYDSHLKGVLRLVSLNFNTVLIHDLGNEGTRHKLQERSAMLHKVIEATTPKQRTGYLLDILRAFLNGNLSSSLPDGIQKLFDKLEDGRMCLCLFHLEFLLRELTILPGWLNQLRVEMADLCKHVLLDDYKSGKYWERIVALVILIRGITNSGDGVVVPANWFKAGSKAKVTFNSYRCFHSNRDPKHLPSLDACTTLEEIFQGVESVDVPCINVILPTNAGFKIEDVVVTFEGPNTTSHIGLQVKESSTGATTKALAQLADESDWNASTKFYLVSGKALNDVDTSNEGVAILGKTSLDYFLGVSGTVWLPEQVDALQDAYKPHYAKPDDSDKDKKLAAEPKSKKQKTS